MTDKTLVERLEAESKAWGERYVLSGARAQVRLAQLLREASDRINTLELEALGAGIKIDDLERAIATAQPAEAVERARKLYEPDEYEDAFKGRTCNDAAQGAVAEIVATPESTHPHAAGPTDVEWLTDWMSMPVGTKLYAEHPTPDTTAAELLGLADRIEARAREWGEAVYDHGIAWAAELRTLAGKIKESGT